MKNVKIGTIVRLIVMILSMVNMLLTVNGKILCLGRKMRCISGCHRLRRFLPLSGLGGRITHLPKKLSRLMNTWRI